jgi:hypothetical protein
MKLEKYTFGMGDRFAHQAVAQLAAISSAWEAGVRVNPVWNKSNREHLLLKTKPEQVRAEAEAAVAASDFSHPYYVDADHIGLQTVDWFTASADFFTIDVADSTGKPATHESMNSFVASMKPWLGRLAIPGIAEPFELTTENVQEVASRFLLASQEAGRIYRRVRERKGNGNFVVECSVDETEKAQSPLELFLILAMIAQEGIPAQTIAPKFTGRFNKGVDYVGDLTRFEKEFDEDLCVVAFAVRQFSLPSSLKLSVHSGSDKFSLYPIMNRLIKKRGAGLHVKTAGTTWLEELIGLAEAGGESLKIAKEIHAGAMRRFDELTGPYASVVDIDMAKLPSPGVVQSWESVKFVAALRHDQRVPAYNRDFRQLMHVAFKIAGEMGMRFTDALKTNETIISRNVTGNLLNRHIMPIFG